MRSDDLIQDPNYVYEQYSGGLPSDTFGPAPLPGSTAITTLSGLTGPTLTIDGNAAVTGYAFTPAGTTITLTLSSAAQARTNLGLGTISTQNSNSVTITGGSITGITDIAVADGGTGSSNAAGARTNLGAAASGANNDINTFAALTGNAGWAAWTGTADKATHATSTATLTNVAEALKALIDTLLTSGVIEV